MNDSPSNTAQPNDDQPVNSQSIESADDAAIEQGAAPASDPPKDDGPPRGPRIFGRFAFFITVVPFIVYLAGGMFGAYLENMRAHAVVKKQKSVASAAINNLSGRIKDNYGEGSPDFERIENRLNLIAIVDMISSEEWTGEQLEGLLGPLSDQDSPPSFSEKKTAAAQLKLLALLKTYDEEHMTRESLSVWSQQTEALDQRIDLDVDELEEVGQTDSASSDVWFPKYKTWYPTTYTITIAVTTILMLLAFPGYFKAPFKITWLSVVVGVVGIFVWIGLVELDRNFIRLGEMLAPTGRDAFNPFKELQSRPTWMKQFMCIRFFGLCVLVPFIEEFFIRGWLMRYIDDPDWDEIPLAYVGQFSAIGVVAYGVMSHMGEPLAAAAWFGLVTWMYFKTKSIWDCVVAHSITNILLGIFVVWTGAWHLW